MLTPAALLNLAGELTDAATDDDAASLAVIAWLLYGEAGENLAEIGRLRAVHRGFPFVAWIAAYDNSWPSAAG